MQSIRITLLTAAVILIAISAIAIACAPAAPSNQGGGRGFPKSMVLSARDGDGDGVVCER